MGNHVGLSTTRIRDATDANFTLGAGQNGYAIVYDHGTSKFILADTAAVAVAAHLLAPDPHAQYLLDSQYTAADVLAKLLTVDGAGSGLDADTLGGLSPAAFALSAHAHAGEDITSGTVADARIAVSLTGKTLVTPTIASFTNAQHTHADAAGGGTISGGGGTPGGSDTQVQFNDGGALGGDAGLTYNKTSNVLTALGGLGVGTTSAPARFVEVKFSDNNRVMLNQASAVDDDYGFRFARNGARQWDFYVTAGDGGLLWYNDTAGFVQRLVQSGRTSMGHGVDPTAVVDLAASTTARASLRVRSGVAPTSPNDGDWWYDGVDHRFGVGGANYSVGTIVRTTKIAPAADSTTALQVTKADGVTAVVTVDTTSGRHSIGYTGAPAAYIDTLVGSDTTTPSLRIRQSNIPTIRWWEFMLASNGGNPALQFQANESASLTYPWFVTETGKFGVGQWSAITPALITLLDRFSIITPSLSGGNFYGATFLDTAAARMYVQISNATDPRSASDAVQILHLNNASGGGDLALAARGSAIATRVRVFAGNGSALVESARHTSTGVAMGQAADATAVADLAASTTARASLRVRSGVAPTSPNDGDWWYDGVDHRLRVGSANFSVGTIVRTTKIAPTADSTTALQVTKADGTTVIANFDTTNSKSQFVTTGSDYVQLENVSGDPTIRLFNSGDVDARIYANTGLIKFSVGVDVSGVITTTGAFTATQLTTLSASAPRLRVQKTGVHIYDWNGATDNKLRLMSTNGTQLMGVEDITGGGGLLGRVSFGTHDPTAQVDIDASTTARASLRVRAGTMATTGVQDGDIGYETWLKFRRGSTTEQIASGVQVTGGGAATAGVIYTSAEQTMLQKCYDAVRAFGLLN